MKSEVLVAFIRPPSLQALYNGLVYILFIVLQKTARARALGATSVSQMRVSTASIWQKKGRLPENW